MTRQFISYESCLIAAQTKLIDCTEHYLANSVLTYSVNQSHRSRSAYVNICFPEGQQNPLPFRYPYIIRISNHLAVEFFSPKLPNAEILISRVHPNDKREAELKEVFKNTTIEYYSTTDAGKQSKLKRELAQAQTEINLLEKKVTYGYAGNFEKIAEEIAAICKVHPLRP